MAYKVFTEKNKGRTGIVSETPTLAVGPDGVITLNKAAMEALLYPLKVRLLWDSALQRFGLESAAHDDPNSYTVMRPTGYSCGQVHSRAFWSFVGHQPLGKFDASLDDNGILSVSVVGTGG